MEEKLSLMCNNCNKPLVMAKADFSYMGKTFHTDVLRCPSCKKVCILPSLAEGKMAEVEILLEDK